MRNAIDLADRPKPSAPALSDELIEASGAHPSDQVIIAGTSHLDLLLSLMRRGFACVACQSPTQGPHTRPGEADVILAPAIRNEADLLGMLGRLGSALRRGGVLVLQATQPFNFHDRARLRRALMDFGFANLERLPDRGDGGSLWRARKQVAALVRAA